MRTLRDIARPAKPALRVSCSRPPAARAHTGSLPATQFRHVVTEFNAAKKPEEQHHLIAPRIMSPLQGPMASLRSTSMG